MSFPAEESADRPRPPQETASPLRPGDDEDIYCPHCGYNLRGLTSGRCPECGNVCDLATMSRSLIPWLHRAEVGRVRAWWQTCWMALRRPGQLAASINAPCPYADARRFWLINVAVVCMPLVAALVFFPITFTLDSLPFGRIWPTAAISQEALLANLTLPWASAMIYRPVAAIVGILGVIFATGSLSYLFQLMPIPSRQQNRAAAMALYSTGALIAGPIVLIVLAVAALLVWIATLAAVGQAVQSMDLSFMCAVTLGFIPPLTVVIWWLASGILYCRLCHASLTRSVVIGVLICLTSLIALVIADGLVPWCIGLVRIIWLSFQA